MLSHGPVIGYSGSHSSPNSSTPTSPPSATSRLEHRVSVFPFSQSLLSLAGCLLPNSASSQSCFNPILYTTWLDSHALTLKKYRAKYYEVRKI
jgi:hypothetical protein